MTVDRFRCDCEHGVSVYTDCALNMVIICESDENSDRLNSFDKVRGKEGETMRLQKQCENRECPYKRTYNIPFDRKVFD